MNIWDFFQLWFNNNSFAVDREFYALIQNIWATIDYVEKMYVLKILFLHLHLN